jgi:hypothetical protein
VKTPNFAPEQYVNAGAFNVACAMLEADTAELAKSALLSGLVAVQSASYTSTGLVLTSVLPAPFGVLFSNGQLARAHGTQSNADTQTYTTDFTSVVPGSGSVTAYLIAQLTAIQQDPFQVIGPPQGHPDYNPSFVPYTAYASLVNSITLGASTTAPDNQTTFELCRFALAAGASTLPAPNTAYQTVLSANNTLQPFNVSGTLTLASGNAGTLLQATSATTFNLPVVALVNGSLFALASATSGVVTTQANGADVIFGTVASPSTGVGSFTIPQGTTVLLLASNGIWRVVGSSQFGITQDVASAISGLASTSYVNSQISAAVSGLASTTYVNSQISAAVSGLASISYVNSQISAAVSGLASVSYVNSQISAAVSGLASTIYVNNAVSGLASTTYVNNAVSGLASLSYVQKQSGNYAVDTGTSNALAITLSPTPASLAALLGVPIRVQKNASFGNSGAVTLKVGSLAATAVTHGNGSPLFIAELPPDSIFTVIYNGTAFILQGVPESVFAYQCSAKAFAICQYSGGSITLVKSFGVSGIAQNGGNGIDVTLSSPSPAGTSWTGIATVSCTNQDGSQNCVGCPPLNLVGPGSVATFRFASLANTGLMPGLAIMTFFGF